MSKSTPTAFIMQIGDKLHSESLMMDWAPDYDDWQLNGDILFWNETLGQAFEVSSMGIRVDSPEPGRTASKAGCEERRSLPFHKMLLDGKAPPLPSAEALVSPVCACCCWEKPILERFRYPCGVMKSSQNVKKPELSFYKQAIKTIERQEGSS